MSRVSLHFVKLYREILQSSIWLEDAATRLVWITLLVMADENGVVMGSVPGIAHTSRVSVEDCQRAINTLSGPDESSRTKDDDGRRITPVDGGWLIINREKYAQRRSSAAIRKARQRNRGTKRTKKDNVPLSPKMSPEGEGEGEVEIMGEDEDLHGNVAREPSPPADSGSSPPGVALALKGYSTRASGMLHELDEHRRSEQVRLGVKLPTWAGPGGSKLEQIAHALEEVGRDGCKRIVTSAAERFARGALQKKWWENLWCGSAWRRELEYMGETPDVATRTIYWLAEPAVWVRDDGWPCDDKGRRLPPSQCGVAGENGTTLWLLRGNRTVVLTESWNQGSWDFERHAERTEQVRA